MLLHTAKRVLDLAGGVDGRARITGRLEVAIDRYSHNGCAQAPLSLNDLFWDPPTMISPSSTAHKRAWQVVAALHLFAYCIVAGTAPSGMMGGSEIRQAFAGFLGVLLSSGYLSWILRTRYGLPGRAEIADMVTSSLFWGALTIIAWGQLHHPDIVHGRIAGVTNAALVATTIIRMAFLLRVRSQAGRTLRT